MEVDVDTLTTDTPDEVSASAEKLFNPPGEAPRQAAVEETAVSLTPEEDNIAADLNRLRDILYGSQARTTEKRLNALENRLSAIHQEMHDLLDKRFHTATETAANELNLTNRTLTDRLAQQSTDQSAQVRSVQQTLTEQLQAQENNLAAQIRTNRRELNERLEQVETSQSTQLQEAQRELNQRLDTLAADLSAQLRQVEKELSERLERTNANQLERLDLLKSESGQRDEALRQELLLLTSQLSERKVSRQDLSQMLVELGLRLRDDKR